MGWPFVATHKHCSPEAETANQRIPEGPAPSPRWETARCRTPARPRQRPEARGCTPAARTPAPPPPCRCKAIGRRSLPSRPEPPLPPSRPSEALGCKQRLIPKQPRDYGEGECEEIYFFKRNMTPTFRPLEPGHDRGGRGVGPAGVSRAPSSVGGGLPQGPARGLRMYFVPCFCPPTPRLVSSLLSQRGEGPAPRPPEASSLWEPPGPGPGPVLCQRPPQAPSPCLKIPQVNATIKSEFCW